MSDVHLANDPAARTPTGEIKNLAAETKVDPKTDPVVDPAAKPVVDPAVKPKEGETLLTKKDDVKAEVPEKYEAFKVPEGYKLDDKVNEEASTMFKAMGLNQENAQKLVDFYVAKANEAAEAPFKLMNETREGWRNEIKADKELGSKLPEVKTAVSKAIDGLGDAKLAADFRAAMDITGVGDHPAFIRAFYKLAQQVNEGKAVTPGNPSKLGQQAPGAAPKSAAAAMYPNLS